MCSTIASTDTLDHLTWYDAAGRTIKTVGPQLVKVEYDRIGRVIRRFTLASHNDTAYADADGVTGDIVLEESHTTFDASTGLATVQAMIQRHPNASTTAAGALYPATPGTSYSYSAIAGRIGITAMYYDELDRVTDSAAYGTAGITAAAGSWTRPGSVPSRSDTVLVSGTTYDAAGRAMDSTDPMGRVQRTEYDAASRRTRTIANYVDGTPGGGTNDDQDQVIAYSYTNGLLATLTADLPGGQTDQTTAYTHGVTRGAGAGDSAIASNRLLWKVAYPDSVGGAGGTDVVSYAYNAQGQAVYVKDQAGNVIDTAYDTLGRETSRVAGTVAGGFDTSVRAIATAYLPRGLVNTVTQYGDTGMSTATDQVGYEYDGWGNLESVTQDVDGVIGAGGIAARSVSYTYDKNAGSGKPNVIRRTGQTLPGSFTLNYLYTGTVNDNASRLYEVNVEAGATDVPIATYEYAGVGTVVSTVLPEPNASTGVFTAPGGTPTYPDLDNFGRVTQSDWWRGTSAAYVDLRLAYDRNGNIVSETDEMVKRQATGGAWTAGDHYFDRVFTNDSLNRLGKADEGHMSGGAIASAKHTRTEEWTLSQTGNWDNQKLDLNGDGDQADSGERDWNGTFNAVNECTARGGHSPVYDAPGNMTDDGVNYTYVYDAFGRLKTVKTRGGSPVTVAEYKYNGLGHRTGWHYDADMDADVDGSDPWYWFFYDERWRIVATYRAGDANPKERFVYHNAGFAGYGGSSYIDSVILRDCDDSVGWASTAPDSTLQTRYYYLQNWRADVVALIQADGTPMEYVRYSAYGVPFVYSAADVNRDGQVDMDDVYAWDDYYYSTGGDAAVDIDLNRDGAVDGTDAALVWDINAWGAWAGSGRGFVSRLDSRKGYAGYEFDPATTQWHVRHRVLVSEMGRWARRDPLGYVDGVNMYSNVYGRPIRFVDPFGLWATGECSSAWCHPPAEELPARDSRQDNRPIDCVTPEESACWDQYTKDMIQAVIAETKSMDDCMKAAPGDGRAVRATLTLGCIRQAGIIRREREAKALEMLTQCLSGLPAEARNRYSVVVPCRLSNLRLSREDGSSDDPCGCKRQHTDNRSQVCDNPACRLVGLAIADCRRRAQQILERCTAQCKFVPDWDHRNPPITIASFGGESGELQPW